MEHTIYEFSKYLNKIGIIENKDFDKMVKQHQDINDDNYDFKITQSLNLILQSRKISYMKTKETKETSNVSKSFSFFDEILDSQALYNGYINLDDQMIVNLFHSILRIKGEKLRETKQRFFYKWRYISIIMKSRAVILASKYREEDEYIKQKEVELASTIKIQNQEQLYYYSDKENKYQHEQDIVRDLSKSKVVKEEHSDVNNQVPIYEKLYKEKYDREAKINEFIRQRNMEDLKECTFKPQVNTKYFKYHPKIERRKEPIYEQLINERNLKELRLKTLSKETEEKLKTQYTFKPVLKSKFKDTKNEKLSFNERVIQYDIKKNLNIEKIKNEIENKHVPIRSISNDNIGKRSLSLINPRDYNIQKQRKIKELESQINKESGITFKPKINANIPVDSNVIERNQLHLRKLEEKLKILSYPNENECTFVPRINEKNNSEERNFIGEEAGYRLHLYYNHYLQKKMQIRENSVENYSFQPYINKNTYLILENKKKELQKLKENFPSESLENTQNIQDFIYQPPYKTKKENLMPSEYYYKKIEEKNKTIPEETIDENEKIYSNKFTFNENVVTPDLISPERNKPQ